MRSSQEMSQVGYYKMPRHERRGKYSTFCMNIIVISRLCINTAKLYHGRLFKLFSDI